MERDLNFEIETHEELNKMLTGALMDVRRGTMKPEMAKSITLIADKLNKNISNANEYKKISKHTNSIKFFDKDFKELTND